jgi:alpha-1,3-rhamnosyl/mannosyltransferase
LTCYVLDARTATPHFPGIGRYVTSLARALAPLLSADERLILPHDPAHPPALPSSAAVQLLPVAASPFSLRQQWLIPCLLQRLIAGGQGSVAHRPFAIGHSRSAIVYHSAYYLMPYAAGAPTVLTVYDLIPLLFPEHSTARARLLFWLTMTLALRTANVVLAISAATRRDFLAHFRLPPERIVTVPLAADPALAPTDVRGQGAGGRRQEAGGSPRRKLPEEYVLYLGSNKPHKNLVRLIEAWRIVTSSFQLPASCLIVAGVWDERYPEVKLRAAELGLGDRVIFLGPVAESDLPALYSGATLFAFPSIYEGFGLPVLEAMACGVPVVCSNVSSLPEVAGAAALLVDPLDVDGLAAAIGRVLADGNLRAELRQKGVAQAARFTWEETARRTLAIYREQVVGSPEHH